MPAAAGEQYTYKNSSKRTHGCEDRLTKIPTKAEAAAVGIRGGSHTEANSGTDT
jgi:hypothetical protein